VALKRGFRPSRLDFLSLEFARAKGPKDSTSECVRKKMQNCPRELCAPEFNLVGARVRYAYATRLGSVHLPGDARRTHVKRSRHLPFYNPKVEGQQVTRV
ncbi:hypothetical protein CRG98_012255, partial [Punica granatum]